MSFVQADAKAPLPGPFDLVCFFDCLHDLGHPVEAARRAREALAEDGTLMLVEPYASDRVEDNLNPVGRIYYTGLDLALLRACDLRGRGRMCSAPRRARRG